jgi:arylsulfatase A-like enzyme
MTKSICYLLTFLTMLVSCQKQKNTPAPPNIIYILADDLGYAELGCYGQEKIETPNIDALASGGMMFTQHYSGAPVCAPSRCVLLTGKHLGHAQIRGNDEWAERGDVWNFEAMAADPNLEGQRPLKPGTQTIGTLLQQAGYKTGIVGKWGLGAPLTEGIPNKQGFDFFYGYNCQRQAHTYFPVHLWKNTEKVPLNNKIVLPNSKLSEGADPYNPDSYSDFWLNDYAPELMQKEVIQFIKANKDQPFFMYYASPIPHAPLQAPKRGLTIMCKNLATKNRIWVNETIFHIVIHMPVTLQWFLISMNRWAKLWLL